MSEIRDCIDCDNYRYWLEIQLTDDAGQPLDNLPFTLKERGTDKSVSGVTDEQGLFRAEGLSARPLMLTADAQSLADKLTADNPGRPLPYPEDSLKSWCRTQGHILNEDNVAGTFSNELPERIYDMSPPQISRLSDYRNRHEGYFLIWPYSHRRVIAIRRITEKVYAKSVLRGTGNTDAGTETERLDNFGQYQTQPLRPDQPVAEAGFPIHYMLQLMGNSLSGGAAGQPYPGLQNTRQNDDDFFQQENSSRSGMSAQSQRKFILTLLNTISPVGMFIAKEHASDSLTYDDLAEKAKNNGTATTRVRIKYQENTATGEQDVVSYATKGSNDQVRVRMGVKAPESEADEIRMGSQAYHSDGLPTPQSLATIYKFALDDGNIVYLGVDTDNKFVELTSSTHPDEFGGRGWHTGGEVDKIDVPADTGNHNPYLPGKTDRPGGFQAHNNGPVILTSPAPDEQGFNDYILITPIADIPAIYVYLSSPFINKDVVRHSGKGAWTEANTMPPRDRKAFPNGRLSGGGHGQSGIKELELRDIEYNIEHTYPNGVRIGNIPNHTSKGKRSGIGQSWFPEHWSDLDIENAGNAIWDSQNSAKVILPSGGTMASGNYGGVFIRVVKDPKGSGSIFPDNKIQS